MSKVFLETWNVGDSGALRDENGNYVVDATGYYGASFRSPEHARLAASAPELVRALLLADGSTYGCVVCGRIGHTDTCEIDAALTKAGYPDATSRDAVRAAMKETR